MPTPGITSDEIKLELQRYLLCNSHIFAVTEIGVYGDSVADLLSMRKNYRAFEYEIKTSKADLDRETRIIKKARSNNFLGLKREDMAKYNKHSHYLYKPRISKHWIVPNYYYFVISKDLLDHAREHIPRPYGIIAVWNEGLSRWGKPMPGFWQENVRRPGALHTDPVPIELLTKVLTKVSWRNYQLLQHRQKQR